VILGVVFGYGVGNPYCFPPLPIGMRRIEMPSQSCVMMHSCDG